MPTSAVARGLVLSPPRVRIFAAVSLAKETILLDAISRTIDAVAV
jgi:hypothetical protein